MIDAGHHHGIERGLVKAVCGELHAIDAGRAFLARTDPEAVEMHALRGRAQLCNRVGDLEHIERHHRAAFQAARIDENADADRFDGFLHVANYTMNLSSSPMVHSRHVAHNRSRAVDPCVRIDCDIDKPFQEEPWLTIRLCRHSQLPLLRCL